ncbi:uncharacterized protein RCO7_06796 [Rhynchosporium graminicola]|uniref:F-box domain-containing protein n=1 Tax=Rhynchosporium graminicola TaxID=2792576 RepID=A0A1E1JY49_9HELO|nr:uncharacterized protein RCO7_06796 [Rhynchosporium commune]
MDLSHIVSDFPFNQDDLSALPAELKRRVIDYLEHHDQLNTRLLSRVWSIIGFERIWLHGLILRPNRNHAQKLIEVSRRPWLRERLKEIVFSVDDIDYIFLARWKVEFRPRYDPVIDAADEVRPSSDFDRAIDRWLFQSKPYYNSMQDVPTPQNDFCDPVLLARTLSVLTSVDSIHIKFGEHLFRNWPYVPQWRTSLKTDAIQNQNIATRAYTSILMGAEAASLYFTTLRMERMPVSCFVSPLEKHQDSPFNHLATMTRAVRNVHTLEVRFSGAWVGAIQQHDGVVAGNVAAFLGSMPLRSLTLEWCDGTCHIDGPLGFYIRHSGFVPLNLASPFYNLTPTPHHPPTSEP